MPTVTRFARAAARARSSVTVASIRARAAREKDDGCGPWAEELDDDRSVLVARYVGAEGSRHSGLAARAEARSTTRRTLSWPRPSGSGRTGGDGSVKPAP